MTCPSACLLDAVRKPIVTRRLRPAGSGPSYGNNGPPSTASKRVMVRSRISRSRLGGSACARQPLRAAASRHTSTVLMRFRIDRVSGDRDMDAAISSPFTTSSLGATGRELPEEGVATKQRVRNRKQKFLDPRLIALLGHPPGQATDPPPARQIAAASHWRSGRPARSRARSGRRTARGRHGRSCP